MISGDFIITNVIITKIQMWKAVWIVLSVVVVFHLSINQVHSTNSPHSLLERIYTNDCDEQIANIGITLFDVSVHSPCGVGTGVPALPQI